MDRLGRFHSSAESRRQEEEEDLFANARLTQLCLRVIAKNIDSYESLECLDTKSVELLYLYCQDRFAIDSLQAMSKFFTANFKMLCLREG